MTTQVEKIKREIEKWQELAIRGIKKGCTAYYQGKLALCIDLLDSINSLPDTDRPILTAKDVGAIFNKVKTCSVKWSATEGAYSEVAEWWNNGNRIEITEHLREMKYNDLMEIYKAVLEELLRRNEEEGFYRRD